MNYILRVNVLWTSQIRTICYSLWVWEEMKWTSHWTNLSGSTPESGIRSCCQLKLQPLVLTLFHHFSWKHHVCEGWYKDNNCCRAASFCWGQITDLSYTFRDTTFLSFCAELELLLFCFFAKHFKSLAVIPYVNFSITKQDSTNYSTISESKRVLHPTGKPGILVQGHSEAS